MLLLYMDHCFTGGRYAAAHLLQRNNASSNSYNLDVSKDVIPPPLDIGSPAEDFEKQWAYNNSNNHGNTSNSVTAGGSSSAVRNSSSAARREVRQHCVNAMMQ
jgi:hypothetical protein